MLYFLKMLQNRRSVHPQTLVGLGGWGLRPQTPKLLLSLNLHITFEHCSDFSALLNYAFKHCSDLSSSLKLRPTISYLSDGWAPLTKLPPLAQTSSYATVDGLKDLKNCGLKSEKVLRPF